MQAGFPLTSGIDGIASNVDGTHSGMNPTVLRRLLVVRVKAHAG